MKGARWALAEGYAPPFQCLYLRLKILSLTNNSESAIFGIPSNKGSLGCLTVPRPSAPRSQMFRSLWLETHFATISWPADQIMTYNVKLETLRFSVRGSIKNFSQTVHTVCIFYSRSRHQAWCDRWQTQFELYDFIVSYFLYIYLFI